jgi:hypothetical protein
MGFVQIVENDHYARFVSTEGDTTFSIYLHEEPVKNPTVVYFENENLDELVSDLKTKGFNFLQDPTDMEYLWREAVLENPAGNKIKLYRALQGENRAPVFRSDSGGVELPGCVRRFNAAAGFSDICADKF